MNNGTTLVADNKGDLIEVEDLSVPADRIYDFVERNRKDYFEDHGLEWCLDEILTRGMAEITRQVKTAAKQKEKNTLSAMVDGLGLTLAEAQSLLTQAANKKRGL